MKSCNNPELGHLYPGRIFYGGRWRTPEQIERFRERCLEYHDENRQACNARAKSRYDARKQKVREIKAKMKCSRCGFADPRALDFHHRNPAEKELQMAAAHAWAWPRIEAEIAKCDVLCANCHRILHVEERAA